MSMKVKEHEQKSINYFTTDGIKLPLEQPDISTHMGAEILHYFASCTLAVPSAGDDRSYIFQYQAGFPNLVKLVGKGRKAWMVSLQEEQIVFLKKYMQEFHLLEPHAN